MIRKVLDFIEEFPENYPGIMTVFSLVLAGMMFYGIVVFGENVHEELVKHQKTSATRSDTVNLKRTR